MSEKTRPTPETLRLAGLLQGVDPHAVEVFADYGPGYWNPFLEHGGTVLFENLDEGMQMLHSLLVSDGDIEEIRPGMALMAQTMWAAVQYEAGRRKAENTAMQGVSHE